MGRAPCCDKANVKKGPWSPEEDATLKCYLETHGTGGNWIALPQKAGLSLSFPIGLKRCGKSCRLRWLNYLRPNIKHGGFTEEEDDIICALYSQMGSRWSLIASQLPGRTDNDVKNYWNTRLKKKHIAGKASLSVKSATNNTVPINGNADPTLTCKSPPLQYCDPKVVADSSVAFSDNSFTRTSVTILPALPDIDYDPIISQISSLSPFQFSLPGVVLSEFGASTITTTSRIACLPEEALSITSDLSFAMDSTSSLSLPGIGGLEDVGMLTDSLYDFARDASSVCQLEDKPNEVALSCYLAELSYIRTQEPDEGVTNQY